MGVGETHSLHTAATRLKVKAKEVIGESIVTASLLGTN